MKKIAYFLMFLLCISFVSAAIGFLTPAKPDEKTYTVNSGKTIGSAKGTLTIINDHQERLEGAYFRTFTLPDKKTSVTITIGGESILIDTKDDTLKKLDPTIKEDWLTIKAPNGAIQVNAKDTTPFLINCKEEEDCTLMLFDKEKSPSILIEGSAEIRDLVAPSLLSPMNDFFIQDILTFRDIDSDKVKEIGFSGETTAEKFPSGSRFNNVELKVSDAVFFLLFPFSAKEREVIEGQIVLQGGTLKKPNTGLIGMTGRNNFFFGEDLTEFIFYDKGKPALTMEGGPFKITKNLLDYRSCWSEGYSCIDVSTSQWRFNLNNHIGESGRKFIESHVIMQNENTKGISVYVDPFEPEVPGGPERVRELEIKDSTKKGKVYLADDGLSEEGAKWYDLQKDLFFFVFDEKKRINDEYECKYKTKTCKINGKVVLGSLDGLSPCSKDTAFECKDDEVCATTPDGDRCIPKVPCNPFKVLGGPEKLDLLIIGDGFGDEESLKREISVILNNKEYGFFSTSPFLENFIKFNIWYMKTDLPLIGFGDTIKPHLGVGTSLGDSCNADYTMILSKKHSFHTAALPGDIGFVALFGTSASKERELAREFTHEFGHVLGKLADEYALSSFLPSPYEGYLFSLVPKGYANCVQTPSQADALWGGVMGLRKDQYTTDGRYYHGCGGNCLDLKNPESSACYSWVKPSENSIMNDHLTDGEFNEPSIWQLKKELAKYS